MKNPAQALLARCEIGWYLWQKMAFTGLALVYFVSPLDIIPDPIPLLGFADDGYVLYLLIRVWRSPTLPRSDDNSAPAYAVEHRRTAPEPRVCVPAMRREDSGGAP